MAWRAWLPDKAAPPWQSMLVGAALGALGVAAGLALHSLNGRELPFFAFFPSLVVAAAFGGRLGGATCLAVVTVGAVALPSERGSSLPWLLGAFWFAAVLTIVVAAALADSARQSRRGEAELAAAQTRLQTLVSELAHRNRNALVVVMSIVSQSARGASSVAAAEAVINARLEALLRAQEVVLRSPRSSAGLRQLLQEVLAPFESTHFEIAAAPEVELEGELAMGLGLVFHELATNALKHGALSKPDGRVAIGWTLQGGTALLQWREAGGPPVETPAHRGFGSRLLEVALLPQGGRTERRFEPGGLVCELHIPAPADPAAARTQAPPGEAFAAASGG